MRKKITSRCCATFTNRRYRYCPYCSAELYWPPTRTELKAIAKRKREHEEKMKDPEYARSYEANQVLLHKSWERELRDFSEPHDLMAGLAGTP